MNLITSVQKHPGYVFCTALILGVLLPYEKEGITSALLPLMGFLLFLSFLGVDVPHVVEEFKKPGRLLVQIGIFFVALPLLFYFILNGMGYSSFAVATLLLVAMPAGLGGPVLTSMANGRIATSVVLSVITHAIVPITVPLLFSQLLGIDVEVNTLAMAKNLALLIGIPMILAWIARTYLSNVIAVTKPHHKFASILALASVAYIVIVPYSATIRADFFSVIPVLLGTYAVYALLGLSAFFLTQNRKPDEQVAIVVSRIYMNNALAIVLAFEFFSKEVALITILAEIPWFTTFGVYLWFQKSFMRQKLG